MNTGIFGGTFNPIHNGHLIIAETILVEKNLDEIIFVPSAKPPHKNNTSIIAPNLRLEMLKLATIDDDRFKISDIEILRDGYSYTIDTMEFLSKKYPYKNLFFIIGADNIPNISNWKRPDDLIKIFSLIIAQRPDFDSVEKLIDETPLPKSLKNKLKKSIVSTPLIDISSTLIRDRRFNGKSIDKLVPKKVNAFIMDNGLYKARRI